MSNLDLSKLTGFAVFTSGMQLLTDIPVATAGLALRWLDDDDSRKVLAIEDDGTEDGTGIPVTRAELERLAAQGH